MFSKVKFASLLGLLSLLFFLLPSASYAGTSLCDSVSGNLVNNCGFEDGVYTSTIGGSTNTSVPNDWTPNAGYDSEPSFNHVTTSPVNSGTYASSIGNFDSQPVPELSQTITDKVGSSYSGYLYVDYGGAGGGDTGAFFNVEIDGVSLLALNDTAPGCAPPAGCYTKYTFSFTGTGSDVLTFGGNTNPSEWYVDDIVVLGPAVTPEPGILLMLSISLLGLALAAWRFDKSSSRPAVGLASGD
jgi:hypothetical protein